MNLSRWTRHGYEVTELDFSVASTLLHDKFYK